jgi:hypothetical protein
MRGVKRDAGTEHLLSNYPCAAASSLRSVDGSTQGKGPQRFPHTTKVAPVPSTVVSYSHSNEEQRKILAYECLGSLARSDIKGDGLIIRALFKASRSARLFCIYLLLSSVC